VQAEEGVEGDGEEVEARAEAQKREGNALFAKGEYVKAESSYSLALELLPAAVALLSNRAKCRLKLKRYDGRTQLGRIGVDISGGVKQGAHSQHASDPWMACAPAPLTAFSIISYKRDTPLPEGPQPKEALLTVFFSF
jgi:tetratricopeptide (TPR) repeat protein